MHLCKQLVESGAAIFASTISDIETAADKCEEMEEGYLQCSQFLYGRRPGGPPRGRRERCVPLSPDGWEGLSTLRFPARGAGEAGCHEQGPGVRPVGLRGPEQ